MINHIIVTDDTLDYFSDDYFVLWCEADKEVDKGIIWDLSEDL